MRLPIGKPARVTPVRDSCTQDAVVAVTKIQNIITNRKIYY